MAAVASQPPTGPSSSRSSSVVNGHAAIEYINGHGTLPDSPASGPVPAPGPAGPATKKAKSKKPVDDNEKAQLVTARLNQLEMGKKEEKDEQLEIGGCTFGNIVDYELLSMPDCYGDVESGMLQWSWIYQSL